jgi:hypothetical protein
MAREITDKMVRSLQLNDVQAEQLYQLNLRDALALEPYLRAMHDARNAYEERRKQLLDARTAELQALLTPEQFVEFEKKRAERQQRMAETREKCKQLKTAPLAPGPEDN